MMDYVKLFRIKNLNLDVELKKSYHVDISLLKPLNIYCLNIITNVFKFLKFT